MDRLEAMSILVQAADAGSLSAASRRLRMPLATVSRKVAALEAHLRTPLLARSARGLTPTAAGLSFLAAARVILEQVSEAERIALGEYTAPRGDLVVAAPVVFGRHHVLPVVTAFLQTYTEVGVTLAMSNRLVNLIEDHVDVAVRFGALPDSSLTATRIGAVRRVMCGSPGYLAAQGTPATPADLAGHACITLEGLAARSAWQFSAVGGTTTVPVASRLSVDTVEGAIDAAVAGMGLTQALSYQVADLVRRGALVPVLAGFEQPAWPVHMVYNGRARLPLKLRAFLDFATPRLRARLRAVELP